MTNPTHLIRLATVEDAHAVQAIYEPYVRGTTISFEYDPPTVEEMARRIRTTTERCPFLVIERDGEVRGYAYASTLRARRAYDWSVETTVYIREDSLGMGYGHALYTSLIEVLRLLGYGQAYAGISLPNPGSRALHERVGFTHLGTYERVGYKFGAWHSVGWWQLLLDPPEGEPPPPRSIADVSGTPELRAALDAGVPLALPKPPAV